MSVDLGQIGATAPLVFVPNQKELAAALDVSTAWVSQLKSAGRIRPEADGRWCVEAVRQQITDTADLGQSIAAETRAQARAVAASPAGEAGVIAPLPIDVPPAADDGDFDHHYGDNHSANFKIARSLREREEAAKARISRMQAAGLLVEKADVERAAYTEARVLRDRLMGLPTKIAPLLAAVTDSFELERMLREALRQVLADCVRPVPGGIA